MINIDYILEDGIFTSHISYIRSEIGAVHSNSLVFLLPLVFNRNQLNPESATYNLQQTTI